MGGWPLYLSELQFNGPLLTYSQFEPVCQSGIDAARLGVKEEDKYALANVEDNLKVPGIGMAEWGPGDMAMSLGVTSGADAVNDPRMVAARAKVLAACKANHIAFLNTMTVRDATKMIQEGVMVGPANQQTTEIGRKFTKRQMPW